MPKDKFPEMLLDSDVGVKRLADMFRNAGLKVEKPKTHIRPTRKKAKQYSDGGVDLYVGRWPIQVKSKHGRHNFTSIEDFPYPTILVDQKRKFLHHRVEAYVILNTDSTVGFAITRSAFKHFRETTITNKRNDGITPEIDYVMMECDMKHAITLDQLIDKLVQHGRANRDMSLIEPWVLLGGEDIQPDAFTRERERARISGRLVEP